MRGLMLGLALLGTAAAAQFGGAGAKGLVYANPVAGARRSAYGHSRVSRASPAAYYRGRQYPVVAAQLSDNLVGETFFGGLHNFLSLYNLVLTVRILLSWFPQVARQPVFEPLFVVTNPFMNSFRGLIPPIGGIDLSPLPAFFLLSFVTQATDTLGAEPCPGKAPQQQKKPSTTLVRCGSFRFHVPAGLKAPWAKK